MCVCGQPSGVRQQPRDSPRFFVLRRMKKNVIRSPYERSALWGLIYGEAVAVLDDPPAAGRSEIQEEVVIFILFPLAQFKIWTLTSADEGFRCSRPFIVHGSG